MSGWPRGARGTAEPIGANRAAGTATSFRQTLELRRFGLEDDGRLAIRHQGGASPVRLELLRDFQVVKPDTEPGWRGERWLVYVGTGIHEPDLGWDNYGDIDLDGACTVILFEIPSPMRASLPVAVGERNPPGSDGFVRRVAEAWRRGSRCFVAIPGSEVPDFWSQLLSDRTQLSLLEPVSPGAIQADRRELSGIGVALSVRGQSELFSGLGSPWNNLPDGLETPLEMRGSTMELDLDVESSPVLADNVAGLIPGTDASLSEQVIVLSAHLDGQGTLPNGTVLNSANDNASSAATLLEVTRQLAQSPARRPIVVLFPTAEENGLLGSLLFTESSPLPFEHYALNVNMEMLGRRRQQGRPYSFRVSGRHSDEIETLVAAAESRHGDVELDYRRRIDTEGDRFRRSDHVNFFLKGVPTIYLYGGGADYHQSTDDPGRIELDKLTTLAEVLLGMIRETDTMDALPVSDGRQ